MPRSIEVTENWSKKNKSEDETHRYSLSIHSLYYFKLLQCSSQNVFTREIISTTIFHLSRNIFCLTLPCYLKKINQLALAGVT